MHYDVDMKANLEKMKLRVQKTLDELFCDSIRFSWEDGETFKEVVKKAVSDRVKRTRDPWKSEGRWTQVGPVAIHL